MAKQVKCVVVVKLSFCEQELAQFEERGRGLHYKAFYPVYLCLPQ